MDHSKHTPLRAEELNAANLEGADVYGPDDNNIGNVSHLHGSGQNAKVVVDVGGFLGLGATRTSRLRRIGRLSFSPRDEATAGMLRRKLVRAGADRRAGMTEDRYPVPKVVCLLGKTAADIKCSGPSYPAALKIVRVPGSPRS